MSVPEPMMREVVDKYPSFLAHHELLEPCSTELVKGSTVTATLSRNLFINTSFISFPFLLCFLRSPLNELLEAKALSALEGPRTKISTHC